MLKLSKLHKGILLYCNDDYTGLWLIIEEVRGCDRSKDTNAEDLKIKTLNVLHDLLESGLIYAGFPTKEGEFEPCLSSPEEVISQIKCEWDALEKPPNIGDVIWFTTTKKGDRVLENTQCKST